MQAPAALPQAVGLTQTAVGADSPATGAWPEWHGCGCQQSTCRRDWEASKLTWLVLLQLPTALLQPGQGSKVSDVLTDGEELQEGTWRIGTSAAVATPGAEAASSRLTSRNHVPRESVEWFSMARSEDCCGTACLATRQVVRLKGRQQPA